MGSSVGVFVGFFLLLEGPRLFERQVTDMGGERVGMDVWRSGKGCVVYVDVMS